MRRFTDWHLVLRVKNILLIGFGFKNAVNSWNRQRADK